MSYMYDVSNPSYRDAGCPTQCSAMYEYATVSEMNGVNGAVPIPPSSQLRLYQTPTTVGATGQTANLPPPTGIAAPGQVAPAGFIRRRA
jgi:hypothetical protein